MGRNGRFENFQIGPSLSNQIGTVNSNSNLEASQVPSLNTVLKPRTCKVSTTCNAATQLLYNFPYRHCQSVIIIIIIIRHAPCQCVAPLKKPSHFLKACQLDAPLLKFCTEEGCGSSRTQSPHI